MERLADQVLVGHAEAGFRPTTEGAEHAIVGTHALARERQETAEAPAAVTIASCQIAHEVVADLRENPAPSRHLESAQGRPHRLRGKARVVDEHAGHQRLGSLVGAVDEGVRIAVAEGIDAVEEVLGPQVPEVPVVEDRVDHRGRVARLHATHVGGAVTLPAVEPVGVLTGIARLPEDRKVHALRGRHVVGVGGDGRLTIRRIHQLSEREVLGEKPVVGPLRVAGRGARREIVVGIWRHATAGTELHAQQARAHLVLGARVGARAEVARRARLHAVAAHLHVPEQRLTEHDGDGLVDDEVLEVRGAWHGNGR